MQTTMTPDLPSPVSDRPAGLSPIRLLRAMGGGRYAFAVLISALGGGLLRPFLLLYAVTISQLSIEWAGLALSAGFVIGLGFVPLAGRWIDTGARTGPMAATLLIRALGLVLLIAVPGPIGFVLACLLQGIGNQAGPVTQGAVVASLSQGFERDAVLASIRSLGNAGLGAGALIATVAVAGGGLGLQWLAGITAAAYFLALLLISGVKIPTPPRSGKEITRRPGKLAETDKLAMRQLNLLNLANLPYAFCFDILEVALPAILVTQLLASPAWASGIFVGNTVMVILIQLPVVIWMAKRARRTVFAAAGFVLSLSYLGFMSAGLLAGDLGAGAIALVSVLYTLGEILYTGVSTALVVDAAPAHLLGRALAGWQLSAGIGRALAPFLITLLISASPGYLWLTLSLSTAVGAVVIYLLAPRDSANRSLRESGCAEAIDAPLSASSPKLKRSRSYQQLARQAEREALLEHHREQAAQQWHQNLR
ncbi:MFS transporter [Psychromicrobium sp. YIM B11713]|uniref:MFS transporter n=1 Tax=Psychromicrobium sp. YIM B11713 TaxID=3145233 RepID=UPI00374FB53D